MRIGSLAHAPARGRNAVVLMTLVLGLAGFLRLFHLTQTPPGLYPDEAMNGNNALEALRTGEFKVFYPENNGREGLMIAIQALSLRVFGVREPWVLRFPSTIIGTLTVLGMFFLGREMFSSGVGLFAAFLTATSTWHIYFSRMSFRVILAPLLMVWALYFFLSALRRIDSGSAWIRTALAGGVIYGLGFYSYLVFRITPLVFLVFLPWRWRSAAFWPVAAVFTLTAFVVAVPIGLYFLREPSELFARSEGIFVFAREQPLYLFFDNIGKMIGMLFVAGDGNWRHNYSGRPELFWPVASLLVVGAARGVYEIYRDRPRSLSYALLLVWAAIVLLTAALSTDAIPSAIRSLLMLPPVLVLAAEGGVAVADVLARQLKRPWLESALAAVMSVVLTTEAYHTYFVLYANRPEPSAWFNADYVEIGRTIERLPRETRKVVVEDFEGVAVRGHRMSAQTVMFMTDTFDPEMAASKNIEYVDPADLGRVAPGVTFHLK
jgi:4-amino-4-deoxy-L-arabinose transferase-like glycosyltransferase